MTDPISDSEASKILSFEDLKRISSMIFEPLGYIVQLKNKENFILWEDSHTTRKRGERIGELCHHVNFGRDKPCPDCTARNSMDFLEPFSKEDRSLKGDWLSVLALPVQYNDELVSVELIKDISLEKTTKQELEMIRNTENLYANILRHDIPNYLNIVNLAV